MICQNFSCLEEVRPYDGLCRGLCNPGRLRIVCYREGHGLEHGYVVLGVADGSAPIEWYRCLLSHSTDHRSFLSETTADIDPACDPPIDYLDVVGLDEIDSQDLWQAGEVGIVMVGNQGTYINSKLDKAVNFVEAMQLAEIIDVQMEIIHF